MGWTCKRNAVWMKALRATIQAAMRYECSCNHSRSDIFGFLLRLGDLEESHPRSEEGPGSQTKAAGKMTVFSPTRINTIFVLQDARPRERNAVKRLS